jgi:hypothetical protein
MTKAQGHRHNVQRDENAAQQAQARQQFSAPLGALRQARLVVVSSASGLELAGDAPPQTLFQAHFGRGNPQSWLQNGIVTVAYSARRFSVGQRRQSQARIALNSSIPWEIELRHSVTRLQADLAQTQIDSLDILGSASHCRLRLARPAGTTFIYIAGGVSHSLLALPADTAVRLQIGGAASGLRFEGQQVRAAVSETRLESAGFEDAASRYDICIAGAASNLVIERYE